MSNVFDTDVLEDILVETTTDVGLHSQLIVFNDDINTFDWVIKCFMEVCSHTYEQSEQLSLIVHYKGKAVVKTDSFDTLKPMKDSLIERGLSAVIESVKEDK